MTRIFSAAHHCARKVLALFPDEDAALAVCKSLLVVDIEGSPATGETARASISYGTMTPPSPERVANGAAQFSKAMNDRVPGFPHHRPIHKAGKTSSGAVKSKLCRSGIRTRHPSTLDITLANFVVVAGRCAAHRQQMSAVGEGPAIHAAHLEVRKGSI
jgi:hypothetical protein